MGSLDPAALKNLHEMVGGDAEFVAELITTYLEDAPQMLTDMQSGDVTLALRAAHSLKSNSAEFGAHALSDMCQELETMCKAGTLAGTDDLVGRINAEYVQVKAELEIARQNL